MPDAPQRTPEELSEMRISRRAWERFQPSWWGWVLIPVVASIFLGVVEWWKRGHNEAAWDRVGADYVSYLIVFVLLTVLLIGWHFACALRDVFCGHRDRWRALEAHERPQASKGPLLRETEVTREYGPPETEAGQEGQA
jgi:hypothetical protein